MKAEDASFEEVYELLEVLDDAYPGIWDRAVSAFETLELLVDELNQPRPDVQRLRALAVVWQRCDPLLRLRLSGDLTRAVQGWVWRSPESQDDGLRADLLLGWLCVGLGPPLSCGSA